MFRILQTYSYIYTNASKFCFYSRYLYKYMYIKIYLSYEDITTQQLIVNATNSC
jgi:hypothetical protein